ncbi:hypothetical protein [Bacillus sp. JJ722]|uniref:hypothetical protein n=1 Tax=Bacillus sp. JJ722 TaxID=3122973 RepID=UPI003000D72D
MECIEQVFEYLGNEFTRCYYDRGGQHILGADHIAKVNIKVIDSGEGFKTTYEMYAPHGEVVAMNSKYYSNFDIYQKAELLTSKRAKEAADKLGAIAVFNEKGKLIDDRINYLEREVKKIEEERKVKEAEAIERLQVFGADRFAG